MELTILRNKDASRYETTVEGALCVLEYRLRDGVLAIDHIAVPEALSGRGIAGRLTQAVLDIARRERWRVVPNCAFAAAWIERHPDYRDLVNPV